MKIINYLIWITFLSVVLISILPVGANTYSSNGIIHWKGIDWGVDSGKTPHGIGEWNNKGAWLDDQNRMHLTITKNKGKWYCTQIYSKNAFRYGTFTWTVDSPIFTFDKNSVVGLYTWADVNQELDIETTKNTLHYTVHCPSKDGVDSYPSINGKETKHRIDWKPNYVRFTSWKADGTVLADYNCTDVSKIPKEPEQIWMDLWLEDSPSDGQNIELIISDFNVTKFIPEPIVTKPVPEPTVSKRIPKHTVTKPISKKIMHNWCNSLSINETRSCIMNYVKRYLEAVKF